MNIRKLLYVSSPVFHPSTALGLAALLITIASAGSPRDAEDPGRLRQALEAIGKDIREEQAELRRKEGEVGRLRSALLALDRQIRDAAVQAEALKDEIRRAQRALEEIEQRKRSYRQRLERSREGLAGALPALLRLSRQGALRTLLTLDDPQRFDRSAQYLGYVRRALVAQLEEVSKNLDETAALEAAAAAKQEQLDAARSRLASERSRLEAAYAQRRERLTELERAIAASQGRLEALKRERAALQALLAELESAVENLPTPGVVQFSKLRGRVPWPAQGRVVDLYGRPRAGTHVRWQGVVVQGGLGDPVRAVARGRVVYADWFRGYGLLLIIDHGHGYMSLYGYNQAIYKGVGEWVEAGERIASMGMSGLRDIPGVYFELRRHAAALNPVRWCSEGVEG